MTQLALGALGGIVLPPDWKDGRGSWCTPDPYATAVGRFRVDPFSNARSIIKSTYACWLERGDDGFGLDRRHVRGCYYTRGVYRCADTRTKVWFQPPYDIVLDALDHFEHTRFVGLLRLDTSTEWFDRMHALCEVIMVPRNDRINFIPPPGVIASANPFPHGIYYRHADDVTDAVKALCYEWKVS